MDRRTFEERGLNPRQRTIRCIFLPQGSAAPTVPATQNRGISSVTRLGAGKFLIVTQDAFKRLVGVSGMVGHANDATDLYVQYGATDAASSHIVKTKKGSVNTDIAAAATSFVSVVLDFEDGDT